MQDDGEEDFFYRPRARGGRGLDPAITRIAMVAGGLTVFVIVIAFIWSGFHAGSFGPPPVITPPDVPLRVAPQNPGGLVVPGADVPIMSGDTSSGGAPQLAPQAQAPDVAQLNAAAGLKPPAPVTPPPTAVPAPPGAVPPSAAAPTSPAAPAAAPPTATPPQAAPPGHPVQVQLAATPDEGAAEAVWASLLKQHPDLLTGRAPSILPAVIKGESVWRVRIGGFDSPQAAQDFCARLVAKGVACMVAGS